MTATASVSLQHQSENMRPREPQIRDCRFRLQLQDCEDDDEGQAEILFLDLDPVLSLCSGQ